MTIPDPPLRRDVLIGLLAVGLLAAPLWVSFLQLGAPTHQYDRVEVTTTDTGIEYVDEDDVPSRTPISDDVDCAGWGGDLRVCSFERRLLDEGSLSTEIYSSNPNHTPSFSMFSASYYRYVQIDGELYEPAYVTNTSAQREDGLYRVEMTLEPAEPDRALDAVSVDVDDGDLPPVVAETARSGPTEASRDVSVPEAPIRLDDGSYYRVYQTGAVDDPVTGERLLAVLLTYGAPVVGLLVLVSLSSRIEVSYRGER